MKKIVLIFLGFAAWNLGFGQDCTPDPNVPDDVIVSPPPYQDSDPMGGLPDTACVGSYYEFVLTFNIPMSYQGFDISSVSVEPENAVANLPASFDYVCNPPNCEFAANTSGCLLVFGTPEAGEEDVYDLKVTANVNFTVVPIPLELELPDDLVPNSNYFLFVKEEGFPNCLVVGTQEEFASNFSLRNQPNPFSGWTQIMVETRLPGEYEFIVSDIFGRTISQRRVQLFEGQNTIEFDGSQLPNGFYLYSLSDGREMVSQKMAISRR